MGKATDDLVAIMDDIDMGRPCPLNKRELDELLADAQREVEAARRRYMAPLHRIVELHDAGHGMRYIAATLNHEGHKTENGNPWRSLDVLRTFSLLDRAGMLPRMRSAK